MPALTEGSLAASRSLNARLLGYIRSGAASTRGQLADLTGLSRSNIAERVAELTSLGLVVEAGTTRSTGGRAPVRLELNARAACVAAVDLSVAGFDVALTDLDARPLTDRSVDWDIGEGPEATLTRVEEEIDRLLSDERARAVAAQPLVGVGVGFPGPVRFDTARPVSPAGLPDWDDYPLGERLGARYGVDVRVDNEANMMAVGEHRLGAAKGVEDFVLIKIGDGIGAGIFSGGRLHRGHLGGSGDIAHIPVPVDASSAITCRCGKQSCLTTVADARALGRTATALARDRRSPALRRAADRSGGPLNARDLMNAALRGDDPSVRALEAAAGHVGRTLAMVVNVLNPELVLLAGDMMAAADIVLPVVRRTVYAESTPLTTRALRIERSDPQGHFGITGAAATVLDHLLGAERLGDWSAISPVRATR
ncbi:ROK family protein [Streptomyces sp. NPDC101455]|uniref:ROK family transcriptional regulator n=1 Tax=Streptomyces sp. NPDC101455 TaxID=3366142 RepID=UPI003824578A